MGRPRSPDFLPRLLEAALDVFGERGLKGARIADIADRMGVAHGTVYNYVDSKDALFWLLVDSGLDPAAAETPSELPVTAPPQAQVLARLASQITQNFTLPRLDAAMQHDRADDARAELIGIIEELFDRTLTTRRYASAFERSAVDLPELYQLFFVQVRRVLFDRIEEYLRRRVSTGQFTVSLSVEVAARYLVETITFFGRHRFRDPDPVRTRDDDVRAQVVDLLVRSFIQEIP